MVWAIQAISGSADVYCVQEAWFGLCVVITGTFFLAILIADITTVYGRQGAADREYLVNMDLLNSYLDHSRTEQATSAKFREYFIENQNHFKKKHHQETLKLLPRKYRAQAARDEFGPAVLRMLIGTFCPFLQLHYLHLFTTKASVGKDQDHSHVRRLSRTSSVSLYPNKGVRGWEHACMLATFT